MHQLTSQAASCPPAAAAAGQEDEGGGAEFGSWPIHEEEGCRSFGNCGGSGSGSRRRRRRGSCHGVWLVWATAGACDGEGPCGALHSVWQHCVGAPLSSPESFLHSYSSPWDYGHLCGTYVVTLLNWTCKCGWSIWQCLELRMDTRNACGTTRLNYSMCSISWCPS